MADTPEQILHPGSTSSPDPAFPNAPSGWTRESATRILEQEGLSESDALWDLVRALQAYCETHPGINTRELHDALNERFHHLGGIRFLYTIAPGGPIAQGCRLAGLKHPAGAVDKGFGSVQ